MKMLLLPIARCSERTDSILSSSNSNASSHVRGISHASGVTRDALGLHSLTMTFFGLHSFGCAGCRFTDTIGSCRVLIFLRTSLELFRWSVVWINMVWINIAQYLSMFWSHWCSHHDILRPRGHKGREMIFGLCGCFAVHCKRQSASSPESRNRIGCPTRFLLLRVEIEQVILLDFYSTVDQAPTPIHLLRV